MKIHRIIATTLLGLSPFLAASWPEPASASETHGHHARVIEIVVKGGYQPARVEIVQGEHVVLKFVRKESSPCTSQVVFPALGIKKDLPEGQPVSVHLPALEPGEYEFQCAMGMIRGKLVVRPRRP